MYLASDPTLFRVGLGGVKNTSFENVLMQRYYKLFYFVERFYSKDCNLILATRVYQENSSSKN
jgi:hypothetical protein